MLLSLIQEDQLDDGWSPVISDYDRVTNPKALREAFSIHKFPTVDLCRMKYRISASRLRKLTD